MWPKAQQFGFDVGMMNPHDLGHDLLAGKFDVVEPAAAQEGVGVVISKSQILVGDDPNPIVLLPNRDQLAVSGGGSERRYTARRLKSSTQYGSGDDRTVNTTGRLSAKRPSSPGGNACMNLPK